MSARDELPANSNSPLRADGLVHRSGLPDRRIGRRLEYRLEQEFDDAGKLKRFSVDYDMQDFMRQLGLM